MEVRATCLVWRVRWVARRASIDSEWGAPEVREIGGVVAEEERGRGDVLDSVGQEFMYISLYVLFRPQESQLLPPLTSRIAKRKSGDFLGSYSCLDYCCMRLCDRDMAIVSPKGCEISTSTNRIPLITGCWLCNVLGYKSEQKSYGTPPRHFQNYVL